MIVPTATVISSPVELVPRNALLAVIVGNSEEFPAAYGGLYSAEPGKAISSMVVAGDCLHRRFALLPQNLTQQK